MYKWKYPSLYIRIHEAKLDSMSCKILLWYWALHLYIWAHIPLKCSRHLYICWSQLEADRLAIYRHSRNHLHYFSLVSTLAFGCLNKYPTTNFLVTAPEAPSTFIVPVSYHISELCLPLTDITAPSQNKRRPKSKVCTNQALTSDEAYGKPSQWADFEALEAYGKFE